MSGRYPDLTNYNDDFLVYIFQTQYPAPTSTYEARCVQDAYTVIRGQRELKGNRLDWLPLFLSVSTPIGTGLQRRVIDFCNHVVTFRERVGWEFLDNLMGDPKKCGSLYCDVGVRNARVAQRFMTTLAIVNPLTKSLLKYG